MRFALVLAGLLAGCVATTGSGAVVSEERDLGAFDRVEASQGVRVRVVVDPTADPRVTVTYDDNLQDQVITRVEGDMLEIRLEGSVVVSGGGDRIVEVVLPRLEGLGADGGAFLTGSGAVRSLDVRADGGARLDLGDLRAERAELDVSGGARVSVRASEEVGGEAFGAAQVTILGDPPRVHVAVGGAASVVRA